MHLPRLRLWCKGIQICNKLLVRPIETTRCNVRQDVLDPRYIGKSWDMPEPPLQEGGHMEEVGGGAIQAVGPLVAPGYHPGVVAASDNGLLGYIKFAKQGFLKDCSCQVQV
jgi:hypothetical protein